MQTWPVQDAKARFSELLNTCLRDGPQMLTRRGSEAAVLVSAKEWERLNRTRRPSLKDLLLADEPTFDLPISPRGGQKRRTPIAG